MEEEQADHEQLENKGANRCQHEDCKILSVILWMANDGVTTAAINLVRNTISMPLSMFANVMTGARNFSKRKKNNDW